MYKKLCTGILLISTTFLSAQPETNTFDDVVEIGNFFEQQSKKVSPDAGELFFNSNILPCKEFVSQAGILDSCVPLKIHNLQTPINTIEELKEVDLQKIMMHEISVSADVFTQALEKIFTPLKIKNKEQLELELKLMEKSQQEKLKYYQYVKYLITSLQDKKVDKNIGKDLKQFADLKDGRSFIKRNCLSLKKCCSSLQQIKVNRFVKYTIISFMMYKFLF